MKPKLLYRLVKTLKLAILAIPPVITLIGAGTGLISLTGPDGPGGDPIPHDPVPI